MESAEIEYLLNGKKYDKLLELFRKNKQYKYYVHHITNVIVRNEMNEDLLNFLNAVDIKLKAKIYESLLFSNNFNKLPIDYYTLLELRNYNKCVSMMTAAVSETYREIYIYCIANHMYFLKNKNIEHYYFLLQLILNEHEKNILQNLLLQLDNIIDNIKYISPLISNDNDKLKNRCIQFINSRLKLNKQELNAFYDNCNKLIYFPFKISNEYHIYRCFNYSLCNYCHSFMSSKYYFNLFNYHKHEKKCRRLKLLFLRYIYKCQYLSLLATLLNLDAAWIILNYLV